MELFFGEYELLGSLGKGSFAEVFLVRHHELGYVRAIRVLDGLIVPNTGEKLMEKRYKKFQHECELLLQLGNGCHPNIVRVYKPAVRENKAFVEMDYVKGNNINEFLEQNQNFVEYGEVIRLATQISSALAYCHEDVWQYRLDRNKYDFSVDPEDNNNVIVTKEEREQLIHDLKIIHNDIHSGNIMRREDGNYILLDFGLSIEGKEFAPSSTRSHGGALVSRAPELWDKGIIPTERSDIYSFGVVLYQCLAGRVPFEWDTTLSAEAADTKMAKAHKNNKPPKIKPLRKKFFEKKYPGKKYKRDYPHWLDKVIMKCLSKNPAKRFKNGKELYEFIMRQESNLSLESAKERIGMLEKKGRRSRLMSIVLSVLCGMCAALCVYLYTNRPVPTDDEKLAEYKKTTIDLKNDTIAELRELLQRGDDAILAQKDARISELESAIQDLTADMPDVAFLEEQLRKKDAQISKLAGQLDDVKVSLNTRNATVASLEEQLRKKDAQISKLSGQLDDVKASLNTQNAAVTSLKGQLDKKDAQIRGLQKQVSQKDTIIKRKNDEIKELREN